MAQRGGQQRPVQWWQVLAGLGVLSAIGGGIGQFIAGSGEIASVVTDQATGPSLAQFQQVQMGMTYDQVVAVLGSPGELEGESSVAGYHTASYHWWGRGDVGANLIIMFQNGRVVSKTQVGLR